MHVFVCLNSNVRIQYRYRVAFSSYWLCCGGGGGSGSDCRRCFSLRLPHSQTVWFFACYIFFFFASFVVFLQMFGCWSVFLSCERERFGSHFCLFVCRYWMYNFHSCSLFIWYVLDDACRYNVYTEHMCVCVYSRSCMMIIRNRYRYCCNVYKKYSNESQMCDGYERKKYANMREQTNKRSRSRSHTQFALKRKKKEWTKKSKTTKAQCARCASDDAKRKKVKFDIERNYVKVFERKYVSVSLVCLLGGLSVLLLHVVNIRKHTQI